jgi:hypothetical protein
MGHLMGEVESREPPRGFHKCPAGDNRRPLGKSAAQTPDCLRFLISGEICRERFCVPVPGDIWRRLFTLAECTPTAR